MTLLNFTEKARQKDIASSSSIVAWLPVSCTDEEKEMKRRNKRALNIASLHNCIKFVMKLLAECALGRHLFKIYDKRSLMQHLMIESYVADLPESKDLLSVKRINWTFMPCLICETNRKGLAGVTTAQRWCWSKRKAAFERTQNTIEGIREKLWVLEEMSMHPVKPILVWFPFVGIHPSVNIYAILYFEPMQN